MDSNIIYILAILLQVGFVIVFFVFINKKKTPKTDVPSDKLSADASEYDRTRYTALRVTPQQLGLSVPASMIKVHGVVMDWDMGGTVLSLSAYINGAANAMLSNGTSAMGSGKNPAVAEQASEFVLVAQDFINRTVPVSETSLPTPGTVRFYLLTNQGIYAAQELLNFIDDNSSFWTPLFFRGNMVLDEIKKGAE